LNVVIGLSWTTIREISRMNFDELKYKTLHSVAYAIATESSVNYLA